MRLAPRRKIFDVSVKIVATLTPTQIQFNRRSTDFALYNKDISVATLSINFGFVKRIL